MFVEHQLSTRHWVYDLETEQITLHFLGVPTKYVLLLQGKWITLSHHSQATQVIGHVLRERQTSFPHPQQWSVRFEDLFAVSMFSINSVTSLASGSLSIVSIHL